MDDVKELETIAGQLVNCTDAELAETALPALADRLPPGYGAQLPIDRITEWFKISLKRTLTAAGEHGRAVLDLLNEERVRGDAHLAAILTAHLVHIFSETKVPLEAITALALLLARYTHRK
jgi:hypothetical protein